MEDLYGILGLEDKTFEASLIDIGKAYKKAADDTMIDNRSVEPFNDAENLKINLLILAYCIFIDKIMLLSRIQFSIVDKEAV